MRVLLVVYDNGSYISDMPLGIMYIAAVLKKQGIEVEIYSQDYHHYTDEHLTAYLDANRFDVIGLGVVGGYYQYRKLLTLSKAINASKNRPFYVIGGHGPSPEPEYFLKISQADAVVMGEGENTIVELVNAIARHQSLSDVQGIAYHDHDGVHINQRRLLIQNIDTIPWPAYDLFPMEYYRLTRLPGAYATEFCSCMLSGRGCHFKCNFCYRMDEGFRPRDSEAIIEEMRYLKDKYHINYIYFDDELLMSSEHRVMQLSEALINAHLGMRWMCNGRLNYAKPAILKLMRRAGCVFINYGIESIDDEILKNMNKCLTIKQIYSGIEATLAEGISPGLNIIFGNIGETAEILEKDVEFLLKYDDGSQIRNIRPVTPYPGSPLYYYALEQGLLKDCQDFYENKHLNSDLLTVNFTNLTDDVFYSLLCKANETLLNNYFKNKNEAYIKLTRKLYDERDVDFRGYRAT
ncbi:MAG: radical SAM protein [Pseudomonadota bacterium]